MVVVAAGCGGGAATPDGAHVVIAIDGGAGNGAGGNVAGATGGGAAVGGSGGKAGGATGGAASGSGGASATGGAGGSGGVNGGGGVKGDGGRDDSGNGNRGAGTGGYGTGGQGTGGFQATGGAGGTAGALATGGAGGTAGAQASGGASASGGAPATGGASGSGGAGNCPTVSAGPTGPHAARSSGYAGNLTDYGALYDTACTTLQDCANACVAAGGTRDSCTMGSECIEGAVAGGAKHCLPPTYWRYADQALTESADWTGAAEQTVVVIAYQDPLLVSDFRLTAPAGSTIRGIQFDVRRSADPLQAVDHAIRVLRDGAPVGTDHKKSDPWPGDLAYVTFGGPTDLWGTTWTAADVQTAGFGISIADKYTATAGNARAYVDYVKATVFYSPPTCP